MEMDLSPGMVILRKGTPRFRIPEDRRFQARPHPLNQRLWEGLRILG